MSMGFPRQEYWSGLPFPSPGDLPDPGIKPMSPALAGGFFTTEPPGKPEEYSIVHTHIHTYHIFFIHSSVNVNGHLGYFHILAVVNRAAINLGVHVSILVKEKLSVW